VKNILSTMSDEDIDDMIVDGKIVMTCEFCSRDYAFDPADFKKEKPDNET
jgi:molecular chaperone Hsp33